MSFKKPALFTTIDNDEYLIQIPQNFVKVDQAFTAIQNDLATITGASVVPEPLT